MSRERSDIEASAYFYTTAEGGRAGPTPDHHFGCILMIGGQNFEALLLLAETGSIAPGQRANVQINFLSPELAKPYCAVGTKFLLRELRPIAEGVIEVTAFA